MATVLHINDSRAVSTVAIGARDVGVESMKNLIETAETKARCAIDRAEAHMSFADMFHEAGMAGLAKSRKEASVSESRMAEVYCAIAGELAS